MRHLYRLFLKAIVLFFVTNAMNQVAIAATPAEQLAQLLAQYKTLSANFTQTIFASNGTLQQTSHGTMLLLRPNYFRWDTITPNKQIITTDGKKLWVYDVDLEQVTIGKLEKATGDTPAMLLTTSGQELQQNFSVTQKTIDTSHQVFQLLPKQKNSQFLWVRMYFTNKTLEKMQIKDNISQMTELRFRDLKVNQALTASAFKIDLPKTVDVINE